MSQENQIVYFPFGQLKRSKYNVRVVNTSDKADQQLLASVRASGLLQNLVVHADEGTDTMFVCGGGRRLSCLDLMFEAGEIDSDYPVPCRVKEKSEAILASISENMHEGMHPADEFMAYQAMKEQGDSLDRISKETGASKHRIKRLLKLAGVAPALVDEYRAGNIDYDAMAAMTVSDDHDAQVGAFKELSPHRLSPYHIRQVLLGESVSTDNALAKFITVEAYKEAGGQVAQDLFNSVNHLHDRGLVERLAFEKLEAEKERLLADGWKWVDVSLDRVYDFSTPQLAPSDESVPQELIDRLRALEEEGDALEEAEEYDHEREGAIIAEQEELESKIEALHTFTDEQKAVAGVRLYITREGALGGDYGYVRKEDRAAAFPSEGDNTSESGDARPASAAIESMALQADLANYQHQAVQAELMNHEVLGRDLILFTVAEQVLKPMQAYERALDISVSSKDLSMTADIEDTAAASSIQKKKERLDLTWLKSKSHSKRWAAFQALSQPAKRRIFAYCAGMLVTQVTGSAGKTVRTETEFDLSKYWTPTADNYFSRIKKGDLLDLVKKPLGSEWVAEHGSRKKGDLADAVAAEPAMEGWMPSSLK